MTHKFNFSITITPKTVLLLLLLGLATVVPFELGSETMTMTTTYPSPAGIYAKLISTQATTLGRDIGPVTIGKATGSSNLIVYGNVGIGTNSPAAKLDVQGSVNIGSASGVASSNLTVNGTIRPGSATSGTNCSSEGAIGYDSTAHVPVFCTAALKWASVLATSAVPSGTLGGVCGPGGAIAPATSCGFYVNDNGPSSGGTGGSMITGCQTGWTLVAVNYHWNSGAGGYAETHCYKN